MSDLRDELYSLLVPLAGERLIVPRACVAEVIGYQTPAEMNNAPPWYVGVVSWSGRNVPVVSFEGASVAQFSGALARDLPGAHGQRNSVDS
jgi:chemosensory pili system protein ChpC